MLPGAIPNVGLAGAIFAVFASVFGAIALRGGDRLGCAGLCLGSLHLLIIMIVLCLMAVTGA